MLLVVPNFKMDGGEKKTLTEHYAVVPVRDKTSVDRNDVNPKVPADLIPGESQFEQKVFSRIADWLRMSLK